MPLILADRVRDTTTTTGTGTVTLSGTAPTGYQNFSVIGNGNTTYYTINAGSQWEVGIGTYSDVGPALARNTVLESSNANTLVDFAAGTKDVFVTYPSDKSVIQDASGNVGIGVVPSAWQIGRALQIGTAGDAALLGFNNNSYLTANANYSSGAWRYTASAAALMYQMAGGIHSWHTAASGTAGNATGFTQAMTLDSAGRLGIGVTAPANQLVLPSDAFLAWRNSGGVEACGISGNAGNNMLFVAGSSERMRITAAGGVAVGTTTDPGAGNIGLAAGGRLQFSSSAYITPENNVSGAEISTPGAITFKAGSGTPERARIAADGALTLNVGGVSNTHQFLYNENGAEIQLSDATGNGPILIDNSGGLARFYKVGTGGMAVGTTGTGAFQFLTNSAERMRINSAGNVGIGVVPGANDFTAVLQTGWVGHGITPRTATNLVFNMNANHNGGGWRYGNNGAAALYIQSDAGHAWFNAPSGTAGNAISFTEGMVLNASNNVGIGTGSPGARLSILTGSNYAATFNTSTIPASSTAIAIGGYLTALGGAGGSGAIRVYHNHGATVASSMAFEVNGATEAMRIDSSGNLNLGTTTGAARLRVAAGGAVNAPVLGNVTNYPAFLSNNDPSYGLGIGTSAADGRVWLQAQRSDSAVAYNITLNEAGGNVGIGTSSPAVRLDVVGNILAREDNAAGANPVLLRNSNTGNNTGKSTSALFQGTDTVGTVKSIGSVGFFPDDSNYIGANLRFLVRGSDAAPTERMRITSSGRVGIGTSAPIQLLQVTTVGQSIDGPFFSSSTGPWMRFIPNSSPGAYNGLVAAGTNALIFSSGSANAGTLTIAPWADATGGVVINASGNVGVGTSTPGVRMDVVGPALTAGTQNTYALWVANSGGANGDLAFGSNASTAFIQSWGGRPLALNSQGNNVLIGTTTAGRTVCIGATDNWIRQSNASRSWLIGMGTQSNYIIWDETGGGPRLTVGTGGEVVASGDMRAPIYYDSQNTFYYMNLDGYSQVNGNGSVNGSSGVGLNIMGVSSNGAIMAFHRAGSFAFNMGLDNDNVFRMGGWSMAASRLQMDLNGNLTMAGNVTAFSDIRLKKDIETIDGALDLVSKMRGVRFTRIENEERNVGVIAQEMLEVCPEVVQQGVGDDDTLSVAYGNLVGVLIEAIKELTTRVVELEGK